MASPSRYRYNIDSPEVQEEKLANGIDLHHENTQLVLCEKLAEFDSIMKFKVTLPEIVSVLKLNNFRLTKSERYVIHEIMEEKNMSSESEENDKLENYLGDGNENENENEITYSSHDLKDWDEPDWIEEDARE
jgi:hypothetical protein